MPGRGDADYEIVGVVADTLYQVGQPARATMYFPVLNGESDPGGVTLVLRTASDPLAFSVPVQKKIAELDPELPVSDVLTLQQIIARSLGNASLSASLVLAFAVLSLVLASVGLYGVLSYLTTQRTGEIGVRMALGAERGQVLRLMLGDGLRPALYGLSLIHIYTPARQKISKHHTRRPTTHHTASCLQNLRRHVRFASCLTPIQNLRC